MPVKLKVESKISWKLYDGKKYIYLFPEWKMYKYKHSKKWLIKMGKILSGCSSLVFSSFVPNLFSRILPSFETSKYAFWKLNLCKSKKNLMGFGSSLSSPDWYLDLTLELYLSE